MKGVGSQVSTCLPYTGIEISWFFVMRDDGGAKAYLGSCLASASLTAGSRVQGMIHV